jgi:prepilin-type N-terminal cleavage/methylation domain-containing protein
MMRSAETKVRGFTLIELAVVIVIVALLLGALLVPLATQVQSRNIKETRESLDEIKEALLGYAVTQARLPCPDTDRDGLENACGGVGIPIDVVEGFLPWQDLAVPATDAWGRIFRYAVAREFTEVAQPGAPAALRQLDLTDASNPLSYPTISVFTRGDDPSAGSGGETKEPIQLTATGSAPAVVLSVGSNGLGGSVLGGPDLAFAAAGDELVNVSAIFPAAIPGRTFRQRLYTPASTPCSDTVEGQSFCEFDDILIWLSAPVLLNRMVEARQLP